MVVFVLFTKHLKSYQHHVKIITCHLYKQRLGFEYFRLTSPLRLRCFWTYWTHGFRCGLWGCSSCVTMLSYIHMSCETKKERKLCIFSKICKCEIRTVCIQTKAAWGLYAHPHRVELEQ